MASHFNSDKGKLCRIWAKKLNLDLYFLPASKKYVLQATSTGEDNFVAELFRCEEIGSMYAYMRTLNVDPLWDNNEIQFARLICEWEAAVDETPLEDLQESTDLSIEDIADVLE